MPIKTFKKNGPRKLLIISPNPFFHSQAQSTVNSPELIFHILKCREQASILLSVHLCKSWWQEKYCRKEYQNSNPISENRKKVSNAILSHCCLTSYSSCTKVNQQRIKKYNNDRCAFWPGKNHK